MAPQPQDEPRCLPSIPLSPTGTSDLFSTPLCGQRFRRKRRVRFAHDDDLLTKFAALHFRDGDFDAQWYSRQEFVFIKRSLSFILKLMEENQGMLDGEEMCSRGLEHRTKKGAARRRSNIETSIDTVMFMQDKHWNREDCSAQLIATAYRDISAKCAMEAFIKGKIDAREVGCDGNSRPSKSKSDARIQSSRGSPEIQPQRKLSDPGRRSRR